MIIIAIITILILHLGKMRHREVKYITQGHTTKKVWIWQSNPGSLAPDSVPLTIMLGFVNVTVEIIFCIPNLHWIISTFLDISYDASDYLTNKSKYSRNSASSKWN